jgi:hypothetical protein
MLSADGLAPGLHRLVNHMSGLQAKTGSEQGERSVKGASRMNGNFHIRFLGEEAAVMPASFASRSHVAYAACACCGIVVFRQHVSHGVCHAKGIVRLGSSPAVCASPLSMVDSICTVLPAGMLDSKAKIDEQKNLDTNFGIRIYAKCTRSCTGIPVNSMIYSRLGIESIG